MDPNIWTISKDRKFFFGTMRTEQPELLLSNDSDSNELLFVAAFNTMHFIAFVNRFSAQLHLINVFKREIRREPLLFELSGLWILYGPILRTKVSNNINGPLGYIFASSIFLTPVVLAILYSVQGGEAQIT